jgi:hypothetical protein
VAEAAAQQEAVVAARPMTEGAPLVAVRQAAEEATPLVVSVLLWPRSRSRINMCG